MAMQGKYGSGHGVFFWDEDELNAVVFRLKPGSEFEIGRMSNSVVGRAQSTRESVGAFSGTYTFERRSHSFLPLAY